MFSKQILLGGLAAIVLSGAAFAADVPLKAPVYTKAPPVLSWEGQYVGVHGGYAWASDDVVAAASTGELKPSGGIYGFQFGYNRQIRPNWVLGYEIDFSFGNFEDTRVLGANTVTRQIDAFGTARTRLGYTRGPWLVYATGGLAWATGGVGPINVAFTFDRPHVGYAVGAGVEYAFAPNWSLKLEYLFADLGETNSNIVGAVINSDLTLSTVRIGVNYRFANWGAPAAAAFPAKAPVRAATWTGPYIGVHGGYASGSFDAVVPGALVDSLDPKGGFGGIQAGYNWQLSRNWVIGIESDSSWGSIDQASGANTIDVDAMGTVRARFGYAMNNLMLYGTGGMAWAHADSVTTAATRDQFYIGWAAGAGIEWAFAPNWSAKIEYLYMDFDRSTDTSGVNIFHNSLELSAIKFGINYRSSLLGLLIGR